MKKTLLSGVSAAILLFSGLTTASANDIIDFLRAVRGASHSQVSHRGHDHNAHHPAHHDHHYDHAIHGRSNYGLSTRELSRQRAFLNARSTRSGYGLYRTSPGITIGTSLHSDRRYRDNSSLYIRPYVPVRSYGQDVYPSVYDTPITPVPSAPIVIPRDSGAPFPGQIGGNQIHRVAPVPSVSPVLPPAVHLPHRFGEIVDCPVPLFTKVHIEDPENIAPHAVPVVVAVRDPNLCDHKCDCCVPRCVYVEVCVPDCPPRSIRVSSCGTELKMDFGKYEVEITSKDGCIEIDYDD